MGSYGRVSRATPNNENASFPGGRPVGVEHGSSVPTKQGDLVWQLASLVERNDSERTAARGIPIDRKELGVDLGGAVLAKPWAATKRGRDGP